MECKEACRKVQDYLNRNLDVEEEEQFLEHIGSCPECYEELELYYTLKQGLMQLDSDDFQVGNLKKALNADIRDSWERIAGYYRMLITRYVFNTLAFLSVLVAFLFQLRLWMDAGLF